MPREGARECLKIGARSEPDQPSHRVQPHPRVAGSQVERGWCRRRESNPHALLGHKILSLARLPVPPRRHVVRSSAYYGRAGAPAGSAWASGRQTSATSCACTPPRFGLTTTRSNVSPSALHSCCTSSTSAASAAASASRCAVSALERRLRAGHVLGLAADPADAAGGRGRPAQRAGADRLAAEQRAEHRGADRHRGGHLLLGRPAAIPSGRC